MAEYFTLRSDLIRRNAISAILNAPNNSRVTIADAQRSSDQNAMLHALLSDLARSPVEWAGKRRKLEEWKVLMVSAHAVATAETPEQARGEVVPGIEGEFVSLRESTARMSVGRASSLIEYVMAFCVGNGVELRDTRKGGFWEDQAA